MFNIKLYFLFIQSLNTCILYRKVNSLNYLKFSWNYNFYNHLINESMELTLMKEILFGLELKQIFFHDNVNEYVIHHLIL